MSAKKPASNALFYKRTSTLVIVVSVILILSIFGILRQKIIDMFSQNDFNFDEDQTSFWITEATADQFAFGPAIYNTTFKDNQGSFGCIEIPVNFGPENYTKGALKHIFTTGEDLTKNTITFNVYIPAAFADSGDFGIQIYVKSTDNWIWDCPPSEWRSHLQEGWHTYSRDMGSILIEGNITAVQEIGIQLTNLAGTEVSDNIYVDDISW